MDRMLKMLEPMTFPTAMSFSPLNAATMEVASSGRLVPMATIVSPMTASETWNSLAISTEPLTKSLAPPMSNATPPITKRMASPMGNGFLSDFCCGCGFELPFCFKASWRFTKV